MSAADAPSAKAPPATTRASAPEGLPIPQRYWATFTVGLAITMAVMDGAIANIALPTIARDLHADAAASVWVVNAYQLTITICLLPFASLGEIHGYRRVYQVGLTVFTLGSLACAFSVSLPVLTLSRILQGIGAAGIMSVNSALMRYIYPQSLLGRGMGITALTVAVSAAVGPTVAAGILSVASWPWLFAVNVPLGVLALIVAARSLPRTPRAPHRFDWISALQNALFFGLLISGIDGLAHGEGSLAMGGELLGAAIVGAVLVQRQLNQASPLLPVDLLRIPLFRLSIATSVCSFAAQMLAYVALPFYMQNVLGRDAVQTGLLMTPWPLATAVIAPISGRLSDRISPGLLGGIGLLVFGFGLLLLGLLPPHASTPDIVWRMAVCGLGFGLFQSPNNRAIISSAPRRRSGGASGMLSTARLLGQTTGTAVVALVFAWFPMHGTTLSLFTGAAVSVLAAAVSSLRLFTPPAAVAAE